MPRLLRLTLALPLLLTGAACTTHADRLNGIRAAYYAGDLSAAEAKIKSSSKWRAQESDVLKLDQALVMLFDGKTREAEKLLREVRDRFDHLEQKDIGEFALSMLTDDQRLAYAGEDYERVLVRAFLALANLMNGGADATAYALQVADKQRQIVEKGQAEDGKNPKESYRQVAVGAYIHAAVREDQLQYDDAARSLQLVCHWAPEFAAGKKELQRVQSGSPSAPGHGVLHVFALTGRGPYKEETIEIATQLALLVADRIVSNNAKRTLPPTIAPIKVPRVVVPDNLVQGVRVNVNGHALGATETLTDIGRMAKEQNDALMPYVIGRAVARRVLKKALVYGAKEAADVKRNDLVDIGMMIGGVLWELTESADTRCWGLLPEKIQAIRLELPAGVHQLALQPVDGGHHSQGPAQTVTVRIENGQNTYVLAAFPGGNSLGQVLCSNR